MPLLSVAWAAVALVAGCEPRNDQVPPTRAIVEWPMPEPERAGLCTDVGDLRVCWGEGQSAHAVSVVPRRTPPARLSSLGFRSVGTGKERRVIDRERDAPPFRCEGNTCRQRSPRLPDDGEWECADFASVVVCRGGERAAGVAPGGAAPGYLCGPRRGVPNERVCVDLSPDMPDGVPRGFRCRFEAAGGLVRVCEREPAAHSVADPCDPARPCDPAFTCEQGRCLPPFPAPTCWLPRDCDNQPCRLGACTGGPP